MLDTETINSLVNAGCKAGREVAIERCAQVADQMQAEWQARTHQDAETRLVAEMLGKCAATIRATV